MIFKPRETSQFHTSEKATVPDVRKEGQFEQLHMFSLATKHKVRFSGGPII